MEARDCLETTLEVRDDPVWKGFLDWESTNGLYPKPTMAMRVHEIWELELAQTLLTFKGSFLAYLQHEVAARISAEAGKRLKKEKEVESKLPKLKEEIELEGFDYDLKKAACIVDAEPRLQQMLEH